MAAMGRAMGHPVVILMPDWMSRERKDLIRSYGACLVEVSAGGGGLLGSMARAEAMARERGVSTSAVRKQRRGARPRSFYRSGDLEPVAPARPARRRVRGACGHGGTVMGVGRDLKARSRSIRVHPLGAGGGRAQAAAD